MPHFDGPMYRGKVVVLSLGGPAIINFTKNYNSSSKVTSLLLEDQSIHIFEAQAYEDVLHGIPDFSVDSIFFKVITEGVSSNLTLKASTVANLSKTRLWNVVVSHLSDLL